MRSDAGGARRALEELERLKAAWLPHWAEQKTAAARAAAGPALDQALTLSKQAAAEVCVGGDGMGGDGMGALERYTLHARMLCGLL